MAVIQRPPKQGNATTYQDKVAQGYVDILASEVDADFDAIYAAWNGGTDTVNIVDGSITGAKLAPGAVGSRELVDGGIQTVDLGNLQVTTGKLADGAVTLAKLDAAAKAMGGDLSGTYPNPALAKVTTGNLPFGTRGLLQAMGSTLDCWANNSSGPTFDNTKPGWLMRLDYVADEFQIWRSPSGATQTWSKYFSINGFSGVQCVLNNGVVTRAAIAVGTLIGNSAFVNSAAAGGSGTPGSWVTMLNLPALTVRGPTGGNCAVFLHVHPGYAVNTSTVGGAIVNQRIIRNGAHVVASPYLVNAPYWVPLPAFTWMDVVPSGATYTYAYQIVVPNAQTAALAPGDTSGGILAVDFG